MTLFSNYFELLNYKLNDIKKKVDISFEFFPPKTKNAEILFWKNIKKLSFLKPNFFSITYSANTGNINLTYSLSKKIKEKTNIIGIPHLTCSNFSKTELINIAQNYWKNNIKNIIALRGDNLYKSHKTQTKMYGVDLVVLLKKIADFKIYVAAYPEVHPEAKSAQFDLINLKNKIDAGANYAITQFFFDTDKYLRFRDRCASIGITADIIPGILPVFNFKQLKIFSNMTNVNIPIWMYKMFEGLDKNDLLSKKIIGAKISIDMVSTLLNEGVNKFHFYTLNCADLSYVICHLIKIIK